MATATVSPAHNHAPWMYAAPAPVQQTTRVAHNPYNCVETDAWENEDTRVNLPPSYNNVPMLVPGTVHTQLGTSCEFMQVPYIAPREMEAALPDEHRSLFLGQIRFEIQPQELRWILRRVAGVTAVKIEARGPGCFLVHLRTDSEVSAVRQLHKRLLFDRTGVWFARSAEEVDAMQTYVSSTLPYVSRQYRLPRDSMVVEEQKSRNANTRHGSGAPSPTLSGMRPSSPYPQMQRHGSGHSSGFYNAETESNGYSGYSSPALTATSAPSSPYHRGHGHSALPCSAMPPLPSYNPSSQASSCGDSPSLAPQSPQTPPPPYC